MERNFCEFCSNNLKQQIDDNLVDIEDIIYCKSCVREEFERVSHAVISMSMEQDDNEFYTQQDLAEKGLVKLGRILDIT